MVSAELHRSGRSRCLRRSDWLKRSGFARNPDWKMSLLPPSIGLRQLRPKHVASAELPQSNEESQRSEETSKSADRFRKTLRFDPYQMDRR